MFKVGLTGGIGSGKSTVANLFRLHNIDVIDADKIARDIVAPGSAVLNEIIAHFGKGLLDHNNELNRSALRQIVFNDPTELEWLNQYLHPKIRAEINRQADNSSSRYVILDIPLLFENKLEHLVHRILVVDVPESVQIERVVVRDNSTPELVKSIMQKQVSREYRLSHADDLLDNTQSLEQLKHNVNQLHQKYLVMANNV
jgi:dephospho-CoA kinase